MVKIDFEFQTAFGLYRDALYLPEGHGMSDAELGVLKQQRVDNWVAVVSAPPAEDEIE